MACEVLHVPTRASCTAVASLLHINAFIEDAHKMSWGEKKEKFVSTQACSWLFLVTVADMQTTGNGICLSRSSSSGFNKKGKWNSWESKATCQTKALNIWALSA